MSPSEAEIRVFRFEIDMGLLTVFHPLRTRRGRETSGMAQFRERLRIAFLGCATGILGSTIYLDNVAANAEGTRELRYGALLLLVAAIGLSFWPRKRD